jgi:hypothetical protein
MTISRRSKAVGTALAAAVGLMLTGCSTLEQIREQVQHTNDYLAGDVRSSLRDIEMATAEAQVSAGSFGTGAVPTDTDALEPWQLQVERIETFIAEHPDMTATNSALRIREGMVLAVAEQPALALAVFAEVDPSTLSNTRDRALYAVHEHLVWWFDAHDRRPPPGGCDASVDPTGPSDCAQALAALDGIAAALDDEALGLTESMGIARYLEQERVRIALFLASMVQVEQDFFDILRAATERYAAQFDGDDRRAIQAWHLEVELDADRRNAVLQSLRYFDYVPEAFEQAEELYRGVCTSDCAPVTPAWVACIADRNC